jgi:uncharacterized membrane protein YdfJ with MMPL/SSD domain
VNLLEMSDISAGQPQSVQLNQTVGSVDANTSPRSEVHLTDNGGKHDFSRPMFTHKKSFEEILKNFGTSVLLKWFTVMLNFRRVFFVSWIVLLLLSVYLSILAFGKTSDSGQPAPDTDSYNAWKLVTQAYGNNVAQSALLVLVQAKGSLNSILDGDYLSQFSIYLNNSLADQRSNGSTNQILDIQGYYLLKSPDLDLLKPSFVSADNKSSFIVISYLWFKTETGSKVRSLVNSFSYSQTNLSISGASMSFGVMGSEVANDDLNASIESDLITFDGIAILVILISFYIFFRKFRFLILPVLNFLTSILFALAIMYPIELNTPISSIAISIMVSMGLAFSTDYTLFYVSRFLDELRQNRRSPQAAAAFALRHIGEIVFTSGSVLLITFMFLLSYNNTFLHGVGVGVSLICATSIFANTTITPMLFLNFPVFFSKNLVSKKDDDHLAQQLIGLPTGKANHFVYLLGNKSSQL